MASSQPDPRQDCIQPEPIAIVGMDCIFPGAPNLAAFWRNIILGASCVRPVPWERWEQHDRDVLPDVPGGFIDEGVEFDPLAFGIMPSEVDEGDPEQFLILSVIDRALRDMKTGSGGLTVASPERTELVIGRGAYISNGAEHLYQRMEVIDQVSDLLGQILPSANGMAAEIRKQLVASLPPVTPEVVACAMPNLTSGRAANRLDIRGRNYTIDAACASSLIAVDNVMRSLRENRADLGIAAGLHINQKPAFWLAFQTIGALSRTGACRPFAADADGLLMGEGIAAVVLKRLSDAQRDHDRIYAVIRSVGVASDGRGTAVVTPRVEGECLSMRRAYEEAGIDPQQVGLVEGHGTATVVGDNAEIDALHTVFGREGSSIALGSVKSMIGHAMPAAGMAGLIKTALSIYHRVLPPTLNVERVHPKLEGSRFAVNTAIRPWVSPPENPRVAAVNAFGFGGINAHAVLEDAPSVLPWESLTPQSSELFLVEAESTAQVIARLNEWSRRSETLRDSDLGEICFTELQRSSGQHPYRLAIVAKDLAELRTKLDRARNRLAEETHAFWQDPSGIFYGASRYPGKLGFLFPGIGFPGLAGGYASRLADLYLHFPEVRRNLDLVDSLTREDNAAQPLSYQLFPPPMLDRAALVQIERDLGWSDRSPIGMSMANMAAWELLKSFGLRADAVAGFSLGELSSLFASEVIDPEHFNLETVRRVRRIMKGFSKASGDVDVLWAMVATSAERAESMMHGLPGNVSVTMDVSPQQIFIGGDASTVRAALQRFQEAKIWGQALPVLPMLLPYLRVHTEQASPFEEQLRMILEAMPLGAGKCPIYSGTTATRYPETPDGIRDMILASVTQPVRIRDTIRAMYADGIRIFVQLGAGGKMLPNVQNTLEGSDHVALSTDLQHRGGLEQIHHLLGRLATLGVPFDLSSLYRYRRCRDLDAPKNTAKSGLRKLSLKPPRVRLPGETVEWIRSQHVAAPEPPPQHPEPTPPPAPVRRNGSFADQTASMMQRFLAEQQSWEDAENQLLHQFLTTQHAAAQALSYYGSSAAQATAVEEAPAEVTWEAEARLRRPFVGVVEHFVPGQELESRLVLDLSRHLFLPEHALINLPDGLKPAEERLATLPLTFEMEILAEVAEALVPELHVVACHSLEAKRWIALESKSTLEIAVRARRIDASEVEVELQPEGHAQPAFRGRATLSSEWPATPEPLAQAYDRECPHTPEQFYSTGPLFHGPMFQLIRSFSGMSHGDIGGELVANGPEAHLGQTTELPMVFEPLLLDALQQIVGYRAWLDGWFTMPIGMKRIWRFAPPPAPGSRVRASVQYRKVDGRRIEASYEAYNEAGQLWVRIDGLQAWRVLCPKTLLEANHRPREGYLGLPWSVGRAGVTCYRVTRDQLGDLNPDWIARLYLRANEWAAYHQRPAVDWLLGRIAAKDAARAWLREHKGLLLHPLEVEIVNEADGAPRLLVPAWPSVAISIAHIEDEAIAVVSEVAGLGVDVAAVKDRGREFSDFAFRKDELACLPEPERQAWIHRGWCAKEAAVKAYRLGFGQLPQFRIDSVEEGTGTMEMHWESGGIRVAADTWLDGKRTIAVVVPET